MLRSHHIQAVIDVRSSPYSRFAPHFSKRPLQQALANAGFRYLYLGDRLGGLPDSQDFYDADGYVLYGKIAATAPFREALDRVIEGASRYRLTLMCAEENPEGCHRRLLVGRALRNRGLTVRHIRGDASVIDDTALPSGDPAANVQASLFEQPALPWRSLHPVRRRSEPSRGPFDPPH
jgi:uncharacterized protein (DUF488 family)